MNTEYLKPIVNHDVGIQVDMFGNETIYITKPNARIVQPTLEDKLKELKYKA